MTYIIISIIALLTQMTLASVKKGELITCISEGWYYIKWLHYALLLVCALSLMPYMISVTDENHQVFAFLTCASLCFVATAPDYNGWEEEVHFLSAIACAFFGCIWATHMLPYSIFIGVAVASISLFDSKRWLLWCELSAFTMVYSALIYNLWN